MQELHMIAGAIKDTWPLMLIPAAIWAWVLICDRLEAIAKRRENLRIEAEAHAARQERICPKRIAKQIDRNTNDWAKEFGSTR